MRFKFTDEDLNRGAIVPAGEWYPVEIVSYKSAFAKTDNSALDKFTSVILNGEHKGVKLYWQFSEKAPGFAIPFVAALTGEAVTKDSPEVEINDNVVGRKLEVYVTRGEYKGKPQNEVSDYRPLSE